MSRQQGSLREVMPVAAELVDWLREQFGREFADKLVRQGQAGCGVFYVAEIGPDREMRRIRRCLTAAPRCRRLAADNTPA